MGNNIFTNMTEKELSICILSVRETLLFVISIKDKKNREEANCIGRQNLNEKIETLN